jgi:hypothetical protein
VSPMGAENSVTHRAPNSVKMETLVPIWDLALRSDSSFAHGQGTPSEREGGSHMQARAEHCQTCPRQCDPC